MVIIFEPVEILGKEKAVAEFRRKEPHWYMESSQRMGSLPDMGRTLRLLLMGLSNHSCAGVVQWIEYQPSKLRMRVQVPSLAPYISCRYLSVYQANSTNLYQLYKNRQALCIHTPIIQLGENVPYKDEVEGSNPSWRAKEIGFEVCLLKLKRKSNFIRLRCGS